MKNEIKIVLVLLSVLMLIISGCSSSEQSSAKGEAKATVGNANNASNNLDAQNSQEPHAYGDFLGPDSEFTGGTLVSDYNLSNIRRVSHPRFIRLVFEFSQAKSGEAGEAPPQYKIKLFNDPNRISIDFNGVSEADVISKKDEVIKLSGQITDLSFTGTKADSSRLDIFLAGPVTYQVFDLGYPARIVVVLNPVGEKVDQI